MRITLGELKRIIREVVESEVGLQEADLFPGDPAMVPKAYRGNAPPLPPEGYKLETQVFPDGTIGVLSKYGDQVVTGVHTAKSTSGPLKVIKYNPKTRAWEDGPMAKGGSYAGPQYGDSRSMKHIGVDEKDWYNR